MTCFCHLNQLLELVADWTANCLHPKMTQETGHRLPPTQTFPRRSRFFFTRSSAAKNHQDNSPTINRHRYVGRPTFQLPIILAAIAALSSMSVSHDSPRQITILPGGGSSARVKCSSGSRDLDDIVRERVSSRVIAPFLCFTK